jgi:AhpD family alkylhydroperoxidase
VPDDHEPRLRPLPEPEWGLLAAGTRDDLGPVLNVHRVMAHHPALLEAWAPLRAHIAGGGSLSARHRELIILRVAHLTGSAYEWHHHAMRGRDAGLTHAEVEAVRVAPSVEWPAPEAALLSAVDELLTARSISEPTWERLASGFTTPQCLDLIFTVGTYLTLAMLIATAGVVIEE